MSWLKRVKKADPEASKAVNEVKPQEIKLKAAKTLSDKDRAAISMLRDEFISTGVLDREVQSFQIEDDADDAYEAASEAGVKANKALPTYDEELDNFISTFVGGENFMLDDTDDEEAFDVYEELPAIPELQKENTSAGVRIRLADGTIVNGSQRKL